MRVMFLILAGLLAAMPALAGERLAGAASLYLRQHAEDPVAWHEWSPQTLEKAAREDKLIFVSVGYAACHWCHVMREESFIDPGIARALNADFIAIKVDRETRPDLDEQFQMATAIIGGAGGWPNSVFLTPTGDPFYAGGYYPRDQFAQLLSVITDAWAADRGALMADGFRVAAALRAYMDQASGSAALTEDAVAQAVAGITEAADPFHGGFGEVTKFPREPVLELLLSHAQRTGDADALNVALMALDGMVRGGLHDHVGGGFHRYTVDPDWHVPHFEKMLYNQAQIARLLIRGWAMTGRREYRRAAERALDYVLRDMTAPEGGFYSAEDADTLSDGHREEGAFYTWSADQFAQALGDAAPIVAPDFGIERDGAFEGTNVLRLLSPPRDPAAWAALDGTLATLKQARDRRLRPIRDEKVLTAWNGEMIATLAEAGQLFGRSDYLNAARRAAAFILRNMWPDDGLRRVYFDGAAAGPAQLADYGGLGIGLLALARHDTHPPRDWAAEAVRVADEMLARLHDPGRSLRMTASSGPLGPIRPLDDTEQPSGNALAMALLTGLEWQAGILEPRAGEVAGLLSADALTAPMQRAGLLDALAARAFGPAGQVRQVASGAVTAQAAFNERTGLVRVVLRVADGWHINAHEPLETYLLPTELRLGPVALGAEGYPEAQLQAFGFSESPLAVYDGHVTLEMTAPGGAEIPVALDVQACNDEQCLQPETLIWRFWRGGR